MKGTQLLKKISDLLDSIILRIVFLLIVGMIVSITLQIVCRVFFDALPWTEEVARYLLVWSTFLGATLAYKRGSHISVTVLIDLFKGKGKKIFTIANIISSLVFFAVIIRYGFKYMSLQATQVSAALRIPIKYVYLVIPVSFIVMVIHGLSTLLNEMLPEEES